MMALAGVELETLVFKPDALTTRPPPCYCCRGECGKISEPVYIA